MSDTSTALRRESVAATEATKGPVLVLDSDAALRRVVRLVIEGAGWRCLTAADVETAEHLITSERPKLLLAEVNLDGEQAGADLARVLAQKGGWRPRVALMSAYPRPRRGYEDYFFQKPLEFDRLLKTLEAVDAEPNW